MIAAALPSELDEAIVLKVQERVLEKARAVMTARRYLDFEGPLGAGIESLQVGPVRDAPLGGTGAKLYSRSAIPIPTAYAQFELPRREVEGAQARGLPLDTSHGEEAGEQVALAEEHVIYLGAPEIGIHGMLTHPDVQRVAMGDWTKPAVVIGDVIAAADRVDSAKMRGPFSLVLASSLYNQLFRKYEGSDVLALDHLRRLADGGIYKSLVIEDGGVLVSPEVGPIVCAQDLSVTFLEVRPSTLRFAVTSALVLRFDYPRAVCVLGRH